MKTLYVRINPKLGATRFYRCGIEFGQAWQSVIDVDDATAQRLEEEQMLEVTEERPAELDDDAPAGDSAAVIVPAVDVAAPPADAPLAVDEAKAPAAEEPAVAALSTKKAAK